MYSRNGDKKTELIVKARFLLDEAKHRLEYTVDFSQISDNIAIFVFKTLMEMYRRKLWHLLTQFEFFVK